MILCVPLYDEHPTVGRTNLLGFFKLGNCRLQAIIRHYPHYPATN